MLFGLWRSSAIPHGRASRWRLSRGREYIRPGACDFLSRWERNEVRANIANFLYKGSAVSSPANVQRLVGCAFLLLIAATGFAQDQERKLIDRLLRPDMELK